MQNSRRAVSGEIGMAGVLVLNHNSWWSSFLVVVVLLYFLPLAYHRTWKQYERTGSAGGCSQKCTGVFRSVNPINNRTEFSAFTILLLLIICLQFWILGIRLGRFQGERIFLVTVRSFEMRPMNICEFCLCIFLPSLNLQHPSALPDKQHTLGLFQSFLTSLPGNISFLEQKTQWAKPWGCIYLQELYGWSKGFHGDT